MIQEIMLVGEKLEQFFHSKQNRRVFKRLLILEAKHNLSLIDCLKKDLKDQQSDELLAIIELLEVENLQLFYGQMIRDSSLLEGIIRNNEDEGQILELLESILLKIKILKAIVTLEFREKENYKKFRLRTRINNLVDRIDTVLKLIIEHN